jgi:diguanylate cyclase (GGDEF)-like protein
MRSSDRVGRIGGEEFVAVLAAADIGEAREVAERIRAAVAGTPADGGDAGAIAVSISIGLAVADATDTSFDRLLARADAALYRAKDAGRNRVCEAVVSPAGQPADHMGDHPADQPADAHPPPTAAQAAVSAFGR